MIVIYKGDRLSVSLWYNIDGMLRGFNTVGDSDFIDPNFYNYTKIGCITFTGISNTSKELITSFGLQKDFVKAVCVSSIENKNNNRERCRDVK